MFDALGKFPLFKGIGFLWMELGGVLLSGRVGVFGGHEGVCNPAENGAQKDADEDDGVALFSLACHAEQGDEGDEVDGEDDRVCFHGVIRGEWLTLLTVMTVLTFLLGSDKI